MSHKVIMSTNLMPLRGTLVKSTCHTWLWALDKRVRGMVDLNSTLALGLVSVCCCQEQATMPTLA